jgi:ADP-glucose pyrophosphorylase
MILGKNLWTYSFDAIKGLKYRFISKNNLFEIDEKQNEINVIQIKERTNGQGDTALKSLAALPQNLDGPISFLSCDNLVFEENIEFAHDSVQDFDLLVWVNRRYLPAKINPKDFSWLEIDESEKVSNFYFKNNPKDTDKAFLIIGNFTFKNLSIAQFYLNKCIEKNVPNQEEIYLDHVIEEMLNDGCSIKIQDIGNFHSIGTKNELDIIRYWEGCSKFLSLTMQGVHA